MTSEQTEENPARKWHRIDPRIFFPVLFSGLLILIVGLSIRNGIDKDTIVQSAAEPSSSTPHIKDDVENSISSEDKVISGEIELPIDEIDADESTSLFEISSPVLLSSASPSAQLSI